MNLSIVTTADGSKTIYNEQVGEHYHSRHGALQESRHVFLSAGLQHFLAGTDVNKVSVLEVGLGTGLNFLITADYCTTKEIKLNYTGIEAYPLTEEMISQTGYEEYVSSSLWESFLKRYPASIGHQVEINPYTQLTTDNRQLTTFTSDQLFDVIYFDAFAAIHQPEMWNEEAIGHTIKFLKPGGVFVTYAITGNLKRMLKALGLKVEKAPGAPGKREMLRAILNE
ncbi:tRNA (5-methylaminomethyl-2-thiouridine)(34)-methyltransferase MnmD [Mucilaginibacter jinjuensis]|uniref:tRNA (5-methylaminomethyl-2-thiouridine)(34)-methyltransferase MnmD n=1 Tax=Mucilaginibacter jinjuensis TaxID=1176721 RepID=A0ABY7TCE1_9SPHI|nr:tRNA (5-methylaminomethyl-2-thiouridine)(34)-methyltransferase MnmD [Mucilaginibacter jinjuensis]WCT13998.1 tRNA (5-methylaminomethyl-2-thiouridine)(34)-methyltransferase MnmD [Mucilaginibacter jinjuensis]